MSLRQALKLPCFPLAATLTRAHDNLQIEFLALKRFEHAFAAVFGEMTMPYERGNEYRPKRRSVYVMPANLGSRLKKLPGYLAVVAFFDIQPCHYSQILMNSKG